MGCSSSKQGRSDYADAFLPPVPTPAPQQAPDLQAPRPVFNHKKTLSAHIREEAELKYGITGPLGNSMSVRGSLKPGPRPGSTASASAYSIAAKDPHSLADPDSLSRSRADTIGSRPAGLPHKASMHIPEDRAVQQDAWPTIDLADEDPLPRPSQAPSVTESAFSTSSQPLQSDGQALPSPLSAWHSTKALLRLYFVPGRNTKGSFHGSMQSRGRSARPSILLPHGPSGTPSQAGSRLGSEAGDPAEGPDMARIGTWVSSQPGSAAHAPGRPVASGRREVDVRRDARKAQAGLPVDLCWSVSSKAVWPLDAASVVRMYDLDDLGEEWQAVLHEIDDRLFQTSRPAMDARERSIAVRSLVESTARESAEAALHRALTIIERSRRQGLA